jgi:hypothetical protein
MAASAAASSSSEKFDSQSAGGPPASLVGVGDDVAVVEGVASDSGWSSPPQPVRVPARARVVAAMRVRFMSVLPEPEAPDVRAFGTSLDDMADW